MAHPSLMDPNFRRRVVLIASHSEEGALGVIINWAIEKTLGEFDPEFAFEPLGKTPMFRGGPVAADQLVFAAWQWMKEDGVFRLGLGLEREQARELLEEQGCEVRAFLGYAGWGKGQLEAEMESRSWVISDFNQELLRRKRGKDLWRSIIAAVSPEMRLLAEAPEDPSVN